MRLQPVEESAQMGDSEPKLGRFEARISCARHFVSKAYEKGSVRCKINTTNQVCSLNVTEDFRISRVQWSIPLCKWAPEDTQKFGPDACKSLGQLRRQLLHLQPMVLMCGYAAGWWWKPINWMVCKRFDGLLSELLIRWNIIKLLKLASMCIYIYIYVYFGVSVYGQSLTKPNPISPRNRIQRSKESCRSLHPVHWPGSSSRKLCEMKWEKLTTMWETQNMKWWTHGWIKLNMYISIYIYIHTREWLDMYIYIYIYILTQDNMTWHNITWHHMTWHDMTEHHIT